MSIEIVSPGMLTTVQDLGRPGYAAQGVPPSGAMDALALRAANLLVGNHEGAAALEITLAGPDLVFHAPALVALAGAETNATLDREPIVHGESVRVPEGGRLRVGRTRAGARCYLSIRGGLDVPVILGSRSTHVAAGLGPPALAAGQHLAVGRTQAPAPARRLRPDALPHWERVAVVRVVQGPQAERFEPASVDGMQFRVSPRSDRTGVRLEGSPLVHRGSPELDPEGMPEGAVQVPADGAPIVLMADRPVTGGYPNIACVIAADLPLVAQARPGDTLRFVEVTREQARAAWRERTRALLEGIEER